MATPQTPRAPRSPLARYAPFIAVVVVIAIVAVVIGIVGERQEDKKEAVTHQHDARPVSRRSPTSRSSTTRRRRQGTLDEVHVAAQLRHDDRARRDPDPATRRRACPKFTGDNGGATVARRDRRHDQDRLLHRRSPTRRSTRC